MPNQGIFHKVTLDTTSAYNAEYSMMRCSCGDTSPLFEKKDVMAWIHGGKEIFAFWDSSWKTYGLPTGVPLNIEVADSSWVSS